MSDTQYDSTNDKTRTVEMLDVEDDEQRQQRMQEIFMQLDNKQQQPRPGNDAPRPFDFGDRTTFMMDPPTELLSRVQAFLPQLAASNAEIARRAKDDPASVDIEAVGSGAAPYIQMDLGLGVFEQQRKAATGDSDAEMHDSESSTTSSCSDTSLRYDPDTASDDSDTDSDDSVDIISSTMTSLASRPIRPLPRRRSTRPHIVMLGTGSTSGSVDNTDAATEKHGDVSSSSEASQ